MKRITSGDTTLITKWTLPFTGWEQVASAVLQCFDPATDIQKHAIKGFGQVWARLTVDFVSDTNIDEYNATKHGFRTRAI